MNMPKLLVTTPFNDAALQSMKSAVNEVWKSIEPDGSENGVVDCQVSVDDLWHKQEHSLMNGFVSVIPQKIKKLLTIKSFQRSVKSA